MNMLFFGDRKGVLAPNWRDELIISVAGDADLDSSAGAGANPSLTFIAIFGDLTLKVPPGSKIELLGGALLGDRKVEVSPGDGPEIRVNAYCLLGDIKVYDGSTGRAPQ